MPVDITIPSPGESITEVTLGPWHKNDGEWVDKDDPLVEIESDKVTLELPAPESGVLTRSAAEGDDMAVGDVIGSIDTSAERPASAPAAASTTAAAAGGGAATATATLAPPEGGPRATSVARKIAQDKGVNLAAIEGTGPSGRITKADVLSAPAQPVQPTEVATNGRPPLVVQAPIGSRTVRRERMSKLRQRIAERLVDAQQTAAMLTTFNEIDMTAVMATRKTHKESFEKAHGVGLGFMSFFVKACASGLMKYPRVNAYIIGNELEYHDFVDVSVAVGTDKGLVVPVLRNVESMSFADIEATIKDYALRARDGALAIEEMTGGTFTISNGGVYGSLNSTPILNPPQSGILGMHKIMKRPVEDPDQPGTIALRPMMNVALSYDHRIVDGEQAVSFLVHVKECLEDPARLMLGI